VMAQKWALMSFLSAVALVSLMGMVAHADDWMLRVQTMRRTCHVQLKIASPFGQDFKGPFQLGKAACQEASNQYDDSATDQQKCWTVKGCMKDGVNLPSK
jgi:hypothetical protein